MDKYSGESTLDAGCHSDDSRVCGEGGQMADELNFDGWNA